MFIRKTTENDIEICAKIYDDARIFMRDNGNKNQWNSGYPNAETVLEDVNAGVSYVCEENGEILAVFMFKIGDDPTYKVIYDGAWLDDNPYAVIHRIAVRKHGGGVAAFCFAECFKLFPNLKIDTHRDNIPMQKALGRAGFEYCGVIHLENGDERIAFQKNK